jgi:hypothetical protein
MDWCGLAPDECPTMLRIQDGTVRAADDAFEFYVVEESDEEGP